MGWAWRIFLTMRPWHFSLSFSVCVFIPSVSLLFLFPKLLLFLVGSWCFPASPNEEFLSLAFFPEFRQLPSCLMFPESWMGGELFSLLLWNTVGWSIPYQHCFRSFYHFTFSHPQIQLGIRLPTLNFCKSEVHINTPSWWEPEACTHTFTQINGWTGVQFCCCLVWNFR